jgi:hypothetical protein
LRNIVRVEFIFRQSQFVQHDGGGRIGHIAGATLLLGVE